MKLYIDTDPYVYKIAFAAQPNCYWVQGLDFETKKEATLFCKEEGVDLEEIEKESFLFSPKYVRQFVKAQLRNIVSNANLALNLEMCEQVEIEPIWCMSSKQNNRMMIDKNYKANRPPPPRWRDFVKNEIASYVVPEVRVGLEADDLVAYWHSLEPEGESCILSIDKDLNNIPGWHYNPDKDLAYYINKEEAQYNFMLQFLTGDSSDNIPGCKGIGDIKGRKLLDQFIEKHGMDLKTYMSYLSNEYADKMPDCADPVIRARANFTLLDVGGYWAEQLGLGFDLEGLEGLRDD